MNRSTFAIFGMLTMLATLSSVLPLPAHAQSSNSPAAIDRAIAAAVALHGEGERERISRGARQVAARWWAEDGDEAAFSAFCREQLITDPLELAATFVRLETAFEQIYGHLYEVRRDLRRVFDLDLGPIGKADELLGQLDLSAHATDDLFKTKVAFLVLLNFPLDSLGDRLGRGASWDRNTWAISRLVEMFEQRVAPAAIQETSRVYSNADSYISAMNIRLDRLIDGTGVKLFPEGLRLISHWGLRDELASHYQEDADGRALDRQQMIYRVMQRIIRQEIPAVVIDNADLLWNPETNEVLPVAGGQPVDPATIQVREADVRYAKLLEVFHAERGIDPFTPSVPSLIDRQFNANRQVPEAEVEALLISVLESAEVGDLAKLIRQKLGRPLAPFDIWYAGFKPRSGHTEADLDAIVQAKYPNLAAFQQGLPVLLGQLGFAPDRAKFLADRIVVDPARGAGHAMPAVRREDRVHLRTRVPSGGMDYKGYNIALHELGHNVEQVFSLHGIDHWTLAGVPNNAFTEALAFVFQHRDLELLGLGKQDEDARRAEELATLWTTYEISGVSLVDMRVWRWLYAHPNATPAEVREATVGIAREVWNRWYAPHFGVRDSEILAVYSHMIAFGLYLPDYALGHLIAFQVAEQFQKGDFGTEIERVAKFGRLTPDAWMRGAVGAPLSARPLLSAVQKALTAKPDSGAEGEGATATESFLDTALSMQLEGPPDWSGNVDKYLAEVRRPADD